MPVKPVVDGLGALTAFAAAVLWFLSAAGSTPQLGAYWGAVPETDPFLIAFRRSARLNRWAAGMAGVSAACGSASWLLT